MANISVIDPIARAWNRMLVICFKPFDIKRWFLLGFCAWLAYLGEDGGSNFNFNFPGGGGRGGAFSRSTTIRTPGGIGSGPEMPYPAEPTPVDEFFSWINAHLVLIIAGAIAATLVGIAIFLLLQWLRARGEFMFVDGIASNRRTELVARPWKEFAKRANSFFIFQSLLALVSSVVSLLIMLLGLWIAWPDIRAWHVGTQALKAIIAVVLIFPIPIFLIMLIYACNRMFIVPIMYVRGQMFLPAWREFMKQIVPGHVGIILLFCLMALLLNLAAGIATAFVTCLTCCIAALPYIGTVIILPILVFLRSYSLCFVEQFGPQYTILSYVDARPGFEVIMPPPAAPTIPPPSPPAPPQTGGTPPVSS